MLKIKELRVALGISQKEIASTLNIPQNTFSQYETGKRTPDIDTLSAMADFFKCSLDDLAGRNDNNDNLIRQKDLLLSLQNEVEIQQLVAQLNEKNNNSELSSDIIAKIREILNKN